MYFDLDGTLTEHVNGSILPTSAYLDPQKCSDYPAGNFGLVNASICKNMRFARIFINKVLPDSINQKDALLETPFGTDVVRFRKKTTFKPSAEGYATFLPLNLDYVYLAFDNSSHLNNLTYNMWVQELFPNDYAIVKTRHKQVPDFFSTSETDRRNDTGEEPIYSKFQHGDWHFDSNKIMSYLVSGKTNNYTHPKDKMINYNVYNCFWENCQIPTPPPVPTGRPDNFKKWSHGPDWEGTEYGYGGFGERVPSSGENIMIQADWWMVYDMPGTVTVDTMYVYGILEFDNNADRHLRANVIVVTGFNGGLIAGFPDEPFLNNLIISLTGNYDSTELPIASDLMLGSKALGIFAQAGFYGKPRSVYWTYLKTTVDKGANSIMLTESPDWVAGDEIILTTTHMEARRTEKLTIASIAGG